jgi:hypothetical protein
MASESRLATETTVAEIDRSIHRPRYLSLSLLSLSGFEAKRPEAGEGPQVTVGRVFITSLRVRTNRSVGSAVTIVGSSKVSNFPVVTLEFVLTVTLDFESSHRSPTH